MVGLSRKRSDLLWGVVSIGLVVLMVCLVVLAVAVTAATVVEIVENGVQP